MEAGPSSTSPAPWSFSTASQNLAAVLNDPTRGKQINFFVKTWGDSFIEKSDIERSIFLPEITYTHFDAYMKKIGRRFKRHRRLASVRIDESKKTVEDVEDVDTTLQVPRIFLQSHFQLNDPNVFQEVYHGKYHDHSLHEELTQYLDLVEMKIAKQVSQKSGAFFHAMTSHDTIMERMSAATIEVRNLREKIKKIDKCLALNSLKLIALNRSRTNQSSLMEKLKLMSTVLQTQPTLQLLLSTSDYVAALELISGTQDVLAKQLAGVTSLRHLPSQLKEMSRLIDKMLSSEFERYAASDLHRPLNGDEEIVDPERLISLTAGLLRQSHLNFLEGYKQEAITATQTILKQLLIEQLADVEDDMEHCLTGSGEAPPNLDSSHWLQVLVLASDALGKLIKRVKTVHDVVLQTAAVSAGEATDFPENAPTTIATEKFLAPEEYQRIRLKLKELLASICDYCHERLAQLVSTQSDKQAITPTQINELSMIVANFSDFSEKICDRQSPALKAAFKIQAGNYVNKFHAVRRNKLTLLLDAERWKSAEVPKEFQVLVNCLTSGEVLSIPTSGENNVNVSQTIHVNGDEYVTVGTVLILIRLICEYCVCAHDLPILANVIYRNLIELLRTFNSRSCQLVLGAGALRTAGLKTITSTNLVLTSRSLQLVLALIPKIRQNFASLSPECTSSFDSVEKDVGHHIQQLESKVLSIMTALIADSLTEWDAKPPIPSKVFRNISKHLGKLHEAITNVLPEDQVRDVYATIHKNFKDQVRTHLNRLHIVNNGGPQHAVVTSELTFYMETMRNLRVLSDKQLSEKGMEDIWGK